MKESKLFKPCDYCNLGIEKDPEACARCDYTVVNKLHIAERSALQRNQEFFTELKIKFQETCALLMEARMEVSPETATKLEECASEFITLLKPYSWKISAPPSMYSYRAFPLKICGLSILFQPFISLFPGKSFFRLVLLE